MQQLTFARWQACKWYEIEWWTDENNENGDDEVGTRGEIMKERVIDVRSDDLKWLEVQAGLGDPIFERLRTASQVSAVDVWANQAKW